MQHNFSVFLCHRHLQMPPLPLQALLALVSCPSLPTSLLVLYCVYIVQWHYMRIHVHVYVVFTLHSLFQESAQCYISH